MIVREQQTKQNVIIVIVWFVPRALRLTSLVEELVAVVSHPTSCVTSALESALQIVNWSESSLPI